jgi:multidrug efflux system outer membrane protein
MRTHIAGYPFRGSPERPRSEAPAVIKRAVALCAAMLLAGCAAGPDYRRPALSTPEKFRFDPAAAAATTRPLGWRNLYRDENLTALIREALANGYDVQIAVARVEEARAAAVEARAGLLPSVSYDGSVSRGKNDEFDGVLPNGGLITNSAAGTLSTFWEFDLWGRVRRQNEAAHDRWLASEQGRREVELSLLSDVAETYFELMELDRELSISENAASSFEESLHIFRQRQEGGTASALESDRAQADWDDAAAEIPAARQAIAQLENRLSVLLGRQPGPIARGSLANSIDRFPAIPPGLPSDLLERRPDILEAEDELRAANADVGESVGEFFPKIGLTAILGKVSPELKDFTRSGATAWGIGADGTGPLFEGGRLVGQYRGAKAARSESEMHYAQAVLNAFRDVSDALIARELQGERRVREADEVSALEQAVQVSRDRYASGKAGYFEVLEAQQQLFPAQLALARTQRDELLASVALYRALGGGWDDTREHP